MAKRKARSKAKQGNKKYRIELTSFSIFLWGTCLFFLLAWIFVLGILVGRGFLPGAVTAISDLKGQIDKLQKLVGTGESHNLAASKNLEPDPKLAFYERLSIKKDEAKERGLPHQNIKGAQEEEPTPEREVFQQVLAKRQTVEDIGNPKRDPEAKGLETRYSVQLASLDEQDKAEKMITALLHRGYAAYFYRVEVKGRTYYRVRCGRFQSREEAATYAEKLRMEEGLKGFVATLE